MTRSLLLALVALALAGCGETIKMRNPQTGVTATCGPYQTGGIGAEAGAMLARQCVEDYKQQGFLRVPN